MNRKELINALAKETKMPQNSAKLFLNSFIDIIKKNIGKKNKDGKAEDIRIVGFGTFKTMTRKARQGRNPQTGELIDIPEKTVAVFKPGCSLNDAVNSTDK